MLLPTEVSISESALLVLDVQDSFRATPRWERRNNKRFEVNLSRILEAYRSAGMPIIFFLHEDGDELFRFGDPEFKLMPFLNRRDTEPLIVKHTRNCFTSTNLQPLLMSLGVRRVAITGIQMEQCCDTSARVAADLGYAVDFVIDATLTFPIPNWDSPGEELGVEAIEERTAYALRRRFARIISAEDLSAELAGTEPQMEAV